MAQDLSKNIVYYDKKYDKSGLIVINKPAGVPLKSSKDAIGLESSGCTSKTLKDYKSHGTIR